MTAGAAPLILRRSTGALRLEGGQTMGYGMRYVFIALALAGGLIGAVADSRAQGVAVPVPREAGRCITDSFGNLTCTDGTRVIKDSFGNYTIIPPRTEQPRQGKAK
jgi:hypothetical protein